MDEDAKKDAEIFAEILSTMTIFGGPQVGFNTNPETKTRPCFIEIKGQKMVCLAQGGECRYNYNYYSSGMRDAKSWTTPIIEEDCPNRCCYKVLVCDDHPDKCEGSITYYPYYNKYRGLFKKYCRNFDKFGIEDGMRATGENKEIKKGKIVKIGKDGEIEVYRSYYDR